MRDKLFIQKKDTTGVRERGYLGIVIPCIEYGDYIKKKGYKYPFVSASFFPGKSCDLVDAQRGMKILVNMNGSHIVSLRTPHNGERI